jgi:L-aspartate oxidase
MPELIETEVLILGSGIGGATAALGLADNGVHVVVATRADEMQESNTYYAQGGIIYTGVDDSPGALTEDILRAGAGHSYPPAAQLLSEEGPPAVEDVLMRRVNVQFDRDAKGAFSLAREGGHTLPRILHVADHTGEAIEVCLARALAEHPNITVLPGHTAVDLLTPSHHALNRLCVYEPLSAVGAYLFDQASGDVKRVIGSKTILATGGLGQIFLRTSNPVGSRGDGVAMAWNAGARVINMEFIQFHPTTFHKEGAPNFLISEAVRGAGAKLVSATGEPFMQRYAPEWRDLAPRDIVARSIHREMLSKGLTHVYLDLRSYVPREEIMTHFPTIAESCREYGIDITRDLVPVVPAARYSCGGVWTDEWGRTTLENLYAVGEVSCTGLHGANRLASTSLLEGLVWGRRAAEDILRCLPRKGRHSAEDIPAWQDTATESPDPALIQQDMSAIKHIMWNYVGLIRTTPRLNRALSELRHLEGEILHFYRRSKLTDELIGLRHAVHTALIVAQAAWENKTSMGAHYRE